MITNFIPIYTIVAVDENIESRKERRRDSIYRKKRDLFMGCVAALSASFVCLHDGVCRYQPSGQR